MVAERRGEQLARQNAQLLEVDKLKSGFVSAVSHDLRTPLTAIQGYAEFLEDELGGPLTPQQRDYVGQIMLGSARLEHLVDDLLDFARIEAGTFQLRWEQVELATKAAEREAFLPEIRRALGRREPDIGQVSKEVADVRRCLGTSPDRAENVDALRDALWIFTLAAAGGDCQRREFHRQVVIRRPKSEDDERRGDSTAAYKQGRTMWDGSNHRESGNGDEMVPICAG